MCLLHTLFEDLECAIELHEKIANQVTALHSLDPRNYLFNGQEEGDYLFGQGIMNEASSDDKEYFFMDTIIIFDLSYYTNITITVTFMNQATLCQHSFSFLQSITCTSPVPSST